jgi:hypothetical protein
VSSMVNIVKVEEGCGMCFLSEKEKESKKINK